MFELPLIDKAFIIDNSSYSSYIKGLDYYSRGHVKSVEVSAEGTVIAKVEGTATYNVELDFNGDFTANCDCPYDLDDYCKHIAAVMVYLMENHESFAAGIKNKNDKQRDIFSKRIEKYILGTSRRVDIKSVVIEYFKKHPDDYKGFRALCENIINKKEGPKLLNKSLKYSKQVERYQKEMKEAFNSCELNKMENYARIRKTLVSSGDINIENYGAGEYKNYCMKKIDNVFEKFYKLADDFLKISDACQAAKIIFAIYEFASAFNEKNISPSRDNKTLQIISGCIKYHCIKSVSKLIETASPENFDCDDGNWFFTNLLHIYFTSGFTGGDRLDKYNKLKFLCSRHGSIEHMHNFINEKLMNNYNPKTGESFYVNSDNAHEAFFLLNIAGESGRAVRIAEKHWRENIVLHGEYIDFLMNNLDHEKALKISIELLKIFDSNPEKSREGTKSAAYFELKKALCSAVKSIDSIISSIVNTSSSRPKTVSNLSVLFKALYTGLVYNCDISLADRILNVISFSEKFNSEGYPVKYAGENITNDSFAALLLNENACDDLFKAKVFKKISRADLVIKTATLVKDDFVFSSICCLIMEDKPGEIFDAFKSRISDIIKCGADKHSYSHIARLVGAMAKIPDKNLEVAKFIEEINSKRFFARRILLSDNGV